ncbi:hypothetical protein TSAR_002385 [Trichomalopsis sarcophagae]|uniref:Uncharacterized protein n=1 Tax=Trichomalopsis sarcophagae TaxID=543379 RepID=A0A232FJ84_9HYME|nr:hypothetical protein TSAR_002385 [Trichomalopsis sarcophagae]
MWESNRSGWLKRPQAVNPILATDFKEYFKNKAKAITNTYVFDYSKIKGSNYFNCSEDQNIKQDLDHILWQCSIYNVQRSTLMEKLKQLKFQEPLASFVILCDPTSELCGTLLRPQAVNPILATDFKEYFKNKAKAITNTYVFDYSKIKGSNYFKYYFNYKSKPWYYNKQLPREITTIINRRRLDHYTLAASLACSEDENIKQDLDHILWQCSIYNVQRSTLMEKLKQLKFQEPLASFVILCDPTSELCGTLLRFFRDCKLQI